MTRLLEKTLLCPFCDATLTLLIDESAGEQRYTEDCHVCCQPMDVNLWLDHDGDLSVTVEQE